MPFLLTLALAAAPDHAAARVRRAGGKLVLTNGVSAIDGAAGGGLASWAVIAGNETRDGIGGTVHATVVALPDFTLTSAGAAVGINDRIELSYAYQRFGTGDAGVALGLGRGFAFGQHIVGAKLRIAGDAVWDQDRWLPQVAMGVQHHIAEQAPTVRAVGAARASGTDVYVAATKLLLAQSLIVNATARWTDASQFGLLGHGGDRITARRVQVEGSAALMLSPRLVVGGEYRSKPDNLRFAREQDAWDAFAVLAVSHRVSVTVAYADLGSIATYRGQRGAFVSVQGSY